MKGPEDIIVTVDPTGKVTVEVNGVKGASCEELTRELVEALGGEAQTQRTEEYRQHVGTGQHQRLRRG